MTSQNQGRLSPALTLLAALIAIGMLAVALVIGSNGGIEQVFAGPAPTATPAPPGPDIDLVVERHLHVVNRANPETLRELEVLLQQGWGIERVDTWDANVKVYFLRWPAE